MNLKRQYYSKGDKFPSLQFVCPKMYSMLQERLHKERKVVLHLVALVVQTIHHRITETNHDIKQGNLFLVQLFMSKILINKIDTSWIGGYATCRCYLKL